MKEVSRKEMMSHQGQMICGPIPVGVDPREWVKSQGQGDRFCVHLFKSPKRGTSSQYPVIQGSFWILVG